MLCSDVYSCVCVLSGMHFMSLMCVCVCVCLSAQVIQRLSGQCWGVRGAAGLLPLISSIMPRCMMGSDPWAGHAQPPLTSCQQRSHPGTPHSPVPTPPSTPTFTPLTIHVHCGTLGDFLHRLLIKGFLFHPSPTSWVTQGAQKKQLCPPPVTTVISSFAVFSKS